MVENTVGGSVRNPKDMAATERQRTVVDQLYRRYSAWLLRTLNTRFRTVSLDLEDLVQETFLRLGRYQPEAAARHPQALIARIAVNLAHDQLRRRAVHQSLGPTELGPFSDTVVQDDRLEQLVLKRLILGLPWPLRDVFLLSRFTGLTYDEIARHLGISVKTVEWRMSKALAICADGLRD